MRKTITFGMEPVSLSTVPVSRTFPVKGGSTTQALLPRVNSAATFDLYFEEWRSLAERFPEAWTVTYHDMSARAYSLASSAGFMPDVMASFNRSRMWRRLKISGCRISNMWYTPNNCHLACQSLMDNYDAAFKMFYDVLSRVPVRCTELSFSVVVPPKTRIDPYIEGIVDRCLLNPRKLSFSHHVRVLRTVSFVFRIHEPLGIGPIQRLCDAFGDGLESVSFGNCLRLSKGDDLQEEYFEETIPPEFRPFVMRPFVRFGSVFVEARHCRFSSRTCKY